MDTQNLLAKGNILVGSCNAEVPSHLQLCVHRIEHLDSLPALWNSCRNRLPAAPAREAGGLRSVPASCATGRAGAAGEGGSGVATTSRRWRVATAIARRCGGSRCMTCDDIGRPARNRAVLDLTMQTVDSAAHERKGRI
eukprot:COSAG01_NODE_1006_length_12163_cov_237.845669_15_plen_139_part_00